MVIAGSLLALLCGAANAAAAALEKREAARGASAGHGLRLLAALARRGYWLLAMALSVLAWTSEAAALGLAPVPVVTTLRSAGRGGLVLAGHRWLGERFGRAELVGVALLAAGGVVTASSAVSVTHAPPPLPNSTELWLVAGAAAVTLGLARWGGALCSGSAVGVAFVATGVFTKEIGDRFVRDGAGAIVPLLATPGPWVMVALSVWAISLLQEAFLHANAATVSATSSAVSANGLIVASALLYHQRLAATGDLPWLVVGIAVSTTGAVALATGGRAKSACRAPAAPPD